MDATTRRLYEMKAEILQAIAHPIRLAVVDFLKDGEQCVCDIARHVGAKRSNVSRHLALMLKAGVLTCRKDGLRIFYSLRTPCVIGFLSCVTRALRERLADEQEVLQRL